MLDEYFRPFRDFLDGVTGVHNTVEFLVLLWIIVMTHQWITTPSPYQQTAKEGEKEEPDPPRNFTVEQLRYFDGTKDEKSGEDKPVYLSVNGQVFDVTDGRDFYGPDGPYSNFAGRECGVALAKMSFDTEHLDDFEGCQNLSPSEKNELDGWIEKFTYYRPYPIKGRCIPDSTLEPLKDRVLTKDDLAKHDGSMSSKSSSSSEQQQQRQDNDEIQEIPEGYATAPIYLGAGDKVYDVSFGGVGFYGPGGGYHLFAGKDASRALALMSFEPENIENSSIEDLEEKSKKILEDWIKTFEEKKKYPVVGKLAK